MDLMINWLVEDGPFEEDIESLIQEIQKQGHHLKLIKYEPFGSGLYNNLFEKDACVIFYGSINLATQLQRQTPWIPGPIATWKHYECTYYYAYYGKWLFNQDYEILPYAEFYRRENRAFNYFVRPNVGTKLFGGHVVQHIDPVGYVCKPHDLIIASRPKEILREWRIVVADRKPISGCQYKYRDKLDLNIYVPSNVYRYVQSILWSSEWTPDKCFTMDIAEDRNGELGLLEINSFCSAGLYCCPVEPVVREISRIALEEYNETIIS